MARKKGKHTIGMSHKDSYSGYWPEGFINGEIICGGTAIRNVGGQMRRRK
jgi:hypothetical protein